MQLRIIRNYGSLKADEIIEASGNTQQFLLQNGIACVAPNQKATAKKEDPECKDCGGDCEDCKSKKKTRNPKPTMQKPIKAKAPAKKTAKKSKK